MNVQKLCCHSGFIRRKIRAILSQLIIDSNNNNKIEEIPKCTETVKMNWPKQILSSSSVSSSPLTIERSLWFHRFIMMMNERRKLLIIDEDAEEDKTAEGCGPIADCLPR